MLHHMLIDALIFAVFFCLGILLSEAAHH